MGHTPHFYLGGKTWVCLGGEIWFVTRPGPPWVIIMECRVLSVMVSELSQSGLVDYLGCLQALRNEEPHIARENTFAKAASLRAPVCQPEKHRETSTPLATLSQCNKNDAAAIPSGPIMGICVCYIFVQDISQ